MPGSYVPSWNDAILMLPEIVLIVMSTALIVTEPMLGNARKRVLGYMSLGALGTALWASIALRGPAETVFNDMLVIDDFTAFFRALVIVVGILTVLCSIRYVERERPGTGEFYPLLLYSVVGQCLMAASGELIMIFIGLEISSIASYVLAGYVRRDPRNNEAAIKYFLLGSFATGFLLYGVAWIYGATGTTNLAGIRQALAGGTPGIPLVVVGTSAALIFAGLAFKVSAAPFQVWAADVYQGAPAPVTAFLTAGPKAAAFAVLLRVFTVGFEPAGIAWEPVVWLVALATMLVGNFAAIVQDNIKRLLAYSSIAHAGYVLVAVTSHSNGGNAAVLFYLAAYAFMNIGAFAIITYFARQGERYVGVDDLAGLSQRRPTVAFLFTIFLLSLIGVPLTGGFFGKFYIFKAALDSGLILLAVLGLLNSAVAAYYYLRILVVMYFREPGAGVADLEQPGAGIQVVAWVSAIATVLLGVFPSLVLDFAGKAAVITAALERAGT